MYFDNVYPFSDCATNTDHALTLLWFGGSEVCYNCPMRIWNLGGLPILWMDMMRM